MKKALLAVAVTLFAPQIVIADNIDEAKFKVRGYIAKDLLIEVKSNLVFPPLVKPSRSNQDTLNTTSVTLDTSGNVAYSTAASPAGGMNNRLNASDPITHRSTKLGKLKVTGESHYQFNLTFREDTNNKLPEGVSLEIIETGTTPYALDSAGISKVSFGGKLTATSKAETGEFEAKYIATVEYM